MSKYVLKTLTVNNKVPMMESTSTAILVPSCHAGISLTPSLIITSTGAVIGKMVRTTQIGLFGNNISKDMNQRGVSKGSVRIPIRPIVKSMALEISVTTTGITMVGPMAWIIVLPTVISVMMVV